MTTSVNKGVSLGANGLLNKSPKLEKSSSNSSTQRIDSEKIGDKRAQRLEEIKSQVANNTYKVNFDATARKMAQDLLNS